MAQQDYSDEMILGDPIEMVSRFVVAQDWFLKQTSAHGVLADIPGKWGHYQLLAEWHDDAEILSVETRLDFMIEDVSDLSILGMLAELNKSLFIGHFQLSNDKQQIILRYRLPLRGAGGVTPEQIEDVVDILLTQCEQAAPVLCQPIYGQHPHDVSATQLVMVTAQGEA